MKKLLFPTLFTLMVFTLSCRKDKEPKERIEIKNPTYSVNCLNCETHGTGNGYKFSSIKVSFEYSKKNNKTSIGTGSYLFVSYRFSDGSVGDYIVDYNNLNIDFAKNTISFDGAWRWATTHNLELEMVLYSGKGSKSNTLEINIPKPVGAEKLFSESENGNPMSGGF